MNERTSVLITGAGLIGAHAARELHDRGARCLLYDLAPSPEYLDTVIGTNNTQIVRGDVADLTRLTELVRENSVGCILHTAGLIGAQVSNQPHRGVTVNVGGTMAVAEAARLAGVRRVVFCSSMAVYDFSRLAPGTSIDEAAPLGPKNLYAATKLACEQLLDQIGRLHGIEVVHLRFAGVFGRGQYAGGSWMGRVVNRAMARSLRHESTELRAEWIGTNEFIYVKDAARAAADACLHPDRLAGPFNIGTGILHTCSEVVAEIRAVLPEAAIEVLDPAEPMASYLERSQPFDISHARSVLGFRPRFTLASGLADYAGELRQFAGQYPTLD